MPAKSERVSLRKRLGSRLTFDHVEDGADTAANTESIAQIFEDSSGARLPMILYTRHSVFL